MISPKLDRFKWKTPDEAIFRCPICGDSKKNKTKCRGGFYVLKDKLMVGCFNCSYNKPFHVFLKQLDAALYKEYVFENFKFNNDHKWFNERIEKQEKKLDIPKKYKLEASRNILPTIQSLPAGHFAKKYIMDRKIPFEFWDTLYFTDNYKKWVNENVAKDKFKVGQSDPRIVIPFLTTKWTPFAYQGRYIGTNPNEERYLSVNPDSGNLLIYGVERLKDGLPVYIVEGPFDSMFLPNGLAVAGSGLQKLLKYKINSVFIFDNEPRNPQICDNMVKVIEGKKDIVIWPKNIKEKDINQMILGGKNVLDIIRQNTYNGLIATIKYNEWRKT